VSAARNRIFSFNGKFMVMVLFRITIVPFTSPKRPSNFLRSLILVATRIKLRKKFDGLLGEVKGTIVIRNRIITMNFPLKENILFLAADTTINHSEIFEKILEILGEKK